MPRLFEDLAMARLDGRFPRLIDKLSRIQLLVLDDWGSHGLTEQQHGDLLEIFEERYKRRYRFLRVSSSYPVPRAGKEENNLNETDSVTQGGVYPSQKSGSPQPGFPTSNQRTTD